MDTETLRRKRSALGTILEQMEVPEMRRELTKRNLMWLNRNIAANNSEHPLFETARELLTQILRAEAKKL